MEFDPFKVNAYSIEELAAFVKSGSLTLQDIYMSGLHYSKHAELEAFLAKDDIEKKKEASDWAMASSAGTVDDYEFYLSKWGNSPFGIHADRARYEIEKINGKIVAVKKELLADMKENPWRYRQENLTNLFKGVDLSNEDVRRFLEDEETPESNFLLTGGKITIDDLKEAGVVPADMKKSDLLAVDYQMPATQIKDMGDFPTDRTDVYFLGVPRSGKSSVLAAIIYKLFKDGRAGYESQLVNNVDPCLGYYNGLIRAISTKKVPQGTATDTVSFMKINIRDRTEKRSNKVTIVEISGESFRQLSEVHLGSDLWAKLGAKQCIMNNNRKLLFFVLDYSVISEKSTFTDIKSMDQVMALSSSLNVFKSDGPDPKNPSKNCTMSKVDTVAVIMTKCDLMDVETQDERLDVAEEYIQSNFLNFMEDLSECCQKYGINKANKFNPYILAFSLGNFTVGNTVLYDGRDADEIINFISNVTRSNEKSSWGGLGGWFR